MAWSHWIFHSPPSRLTIGPAAKLQLLRMNCPLSQLIVPELVSAPSKLTPPAASKLSTPLAAMVRPLPCIVPPAQLNWPEIITGAVRLIVPLVKLIVSLAAGTPLGHQLFGLNQSLLAEPFQALLFCASPGVRHDSVTTETRSECLKFIAGSR